MLPGAKFPLRRFLEVQSLVWTYGCLDARPQSPRGGWQPASHTLKTFALPCSSPGVGDKVNLGAGDQSPLSAQDSGLGRVTQQVPAPTAAGCSADDAPGHSSLSIHRGAMESTRDGVGR